MEKISKYLRDPQVMVLGIFCRNHDERLCRDSSKIRANESIDTAPVLEQITALTKINGELREQITELKNRVQPEVQIENLADLDSEMSIRTTFKDSWRDSDTQSRTFKLSLGIVFGLIAPKLLEHPSDGAIKTYFVAQLFANAHKDSYEPKVNEQDFQTLKVQLMALRLIDVSYSKTVSGSAGLFWSLTDRGSERLIYLRAIRKSP